MRFSPFLFCLRFIVKAETLKNFLNGTKNIVDIKIASEELRTSVPVQNEQESTKSLFWIHFPFAVRPQVCRRGDRVERVACRAREARIQDYNY